MTAAPVASPLAGILVADFSRVLAGPLASMTLGDLGADVVKVERPGNGDDTRAWGPPFAADGHSAYYLSVNRNKRSIALDLKDPADLEIACRLAGSADVVIENFRAGTMERLELDYETLRDANPGVVYCRVSGFGSEGGNDLPGYDFLAQALSGFMSITGDPDGPPIKTGVAIVDVLTGLYATIAILAALLERRESGTGQFVDVNLLSSALAGLVNQASTFLNAGTVPTRMGNQHPNIAPYETLATATTPIAVAVGNDGQFRSLCAAIGRPELAADPRWASNAGRVVERAALVEALEAALRERPAETWVEQLRAHDIPCGEVNDIGQAFELAERLRLGAVAAFARTDRPTVSTVASPMSLSRTPVTYRLPPPDLGAHGDEILEFLRRRT